MHKYMNEVFIENKELKDINPRACGEAQCMPGHYWPEYDASRGSRPYYLLHYVMSGCGVLYAPEDRYEVKAGQVFVVLPNELIAYEADMDDPWRYCWIGFESMLDLSNVFPQYVISVPECAHIFNAFRDCVNITQDREWYICGKIFELLSLLDTHKNPEKNQTQRYVKIAQNYIDVHYSDSDLKVSSMAAKLNLDRAYFSKIFNKYTGKSPQQYIVELRLDRAADIMVNQGLSPGEAAQHVGYGDIFNFSRMFKRRFGVSPSAYASLTGHRLPDSGRVL